MVVCVQRTLLPAGPSEMVARVMTMQDHEEGGDLRCPRPAPPLWEPTEDLCCITTTFQYLHSSGWYWGSVSASQARDALLKVSVGTFLVRDSSHPHYMLTLSVRTCGGPTSVRIEYAEGRFRLDSSSPGLPRLRAFPDVHSLVQHYAGFGPREDGGRRWDRRRSDSTEGDPPFGAGALLLKLRQPLHRPRAFPPLQHLARLAVHRHTDRPAQLPLPLPLLRYLQEYPFLV